MISIGFFLKYDNYSEIPLIDSQIDPIEWFNYFVISQAQAQPAAMIYHYIIVIVWLPLCLGFLRKARTVVFGIPPRRFALGSFSFSRPTPPGCWHSPDDFKRMAIIFLHTIIPYYDLFHDLGTSSRSASPHK